MTNTPRVPATPLDPLRFPSIATPARTSEPGGPAFEALLDRLTSRAAELEQKSRTLAKPEELPEAMDTARASLEDAMALGQELLEAFRAAQVRGLDGTQSNEVRP